MAEKKIQATASKTSKRPGPGRPTKEQARLRNLQLLDKALDLFVENGYERTTMEGIAAAVGMAKRTVYALYGDKKSLFIAALERAIEEWIVPIDSLRAAETDDFEGTLLRVGKILVDNIMKPEGLRLLSITNAEAGRMPEIGAYTTERGTKQTIEYLADLFRRRAGVDIPDADEAAAAFLYLVVGGPANSTAWGVSRRAKDIDKQRDYCVRLFLHGLLSDQVR